MRKILIVPIDKVNDFFEMAKNNNITEIIEGVPKYLKDIYTNDQLPIIHTEDEPTPQLTEVELLKEENTELKKTVSQMSADFQGLTDLLVQQGVIQ